MAVSRPREATARAASGPATGLKLSSFGRSRQPYRLQSQSNSKQHASLQRIPRVHRPGDRHGEACSQDGWHREGGLQGAQRLSRQAGEGLQNQKYPSGTGEEELGRRAGGGGGVLHGRGRGTVQDGGGPLGGVRRRREGSGGRLGQAGGGVQGVAQDEQRGAGGDGGVGKRMAEE